MANDNVFDLEGKVAVITGGGGVLCGAMAKELGSRGVKVAILDLKKEAAENIASQISETNGEAIGLECNVLDRASLEQACSQILNTFGPSSILVNGAGGNNPKATTSKEKLSPEDLKGQIKDLKTFFDLEPEGVQFVFNLNFLGTLLPSQIFGRVMAEQEGGVILNISSMNALRPLTKIPAYSAAKAAVSNFTQWLATHFAPVNIRVNAIAPGFFLTEQNRFLLTDKKTGQLTERGQTIIGHTPMGRFGKPEDLTGTLIWLVSDASNFVTGVVVPVDGGFSAFSGV
ncbi:SDR family oxidoreductase [candidate division NPL-UPA2 bacterium]|nr:SDR family oxidoreductase [candidate division NPL-UPA2 bacterium]